MCGNNQTYTRYAFVFIKKEQVKGKGVRNFVLLSLNKWKPKCLWVLVLTARMLPLVRSASGAERCQSLPCWMWFQVAVTIWGTAIRDSEAMWISLRYLYPEFLFTFANHTRKKGKKMRLGNKKAGGFSCFGFVFHMCMNISNEWEKYLCSPSKEIQNVLCLMQKTSPFERVICYLWL